MVRKTKLKGFKFFLNRALLHTSPSYCYKYNTYTIHNFVAIGRYWHCHWVHSPFALLGLPDVSVIFPNKWISHWGGGAKQMQNEKKNYHKKKIARRIIIKWKTTVCFAFNTCQNKLRCKLIKMGQLESPKKDTTKI